MTSRAENPIATLDDKFFKAHELLIPGAIIDRTAYLGVVETYHGLLQREAVALATARVPVLAAGQAYERAVQALEDKRRSIYIEPPVPGNFRDLITRARAELRVAFANNRVPWFLGFTRRLALPEHPEVRELSTRADQLRDSLQVASRQAEEGERGVGQEYGGQVAQASRRVVSERDKILTASEAVIAGTGQVDNLVNYCMILPGGIRVNRSGLAVRTFAGANEAKLLQTRVADFADFVRAVSADNPRLTERMTPFIMRVYDEIAACQGAGAVMDLDLDKVCQADRKFEYGRHRWQAYLVYYLSQQLHQAGVLEAAPEIPQTFYR